MAIYTKNDLKTRINAGIKGKIGVLVNADDTMNQVVREVNTEVDLRSTRRMVTLQPGVFDSVYAYQAPVDLKAQKILSLREQANQDATYFGYNLIPYEQFNARYGYYGRSIGDGSFDNGVLINNREPYTIAFDDLNGLRRLLIAKPQNGTSQTISPLDVANDGVTSWILYGGAQNVATDSGNYLYGAGSVKFDIGPTAVTTAGIQSLTIPTFSISDFLNSNDSIFVSAYLANADDITNFKVRLGVDVANYYEFTATATNVNTVFATGWNVIRFDISSMTTVGTVDPDNLTFAAVFMTKATTKISQTPFRFDNLFIGSGDIMQIRYYSKYGWQTQAGVWLENSVNDDDFINADSDEFNLFIDKGIYLAGQEVDETIASETANTRYQENLGRYLMNNPSEALIETSDYQAQYYI